MYIASIMPPQVTPYQGWTPCIAWCEERSMVFRYVGEGVFSFNNSEDHLLFMLKWAGNNLIKHE